MDIKFKKCPNDKDGFIVRVQVQVQEIGFPNCPHCGLKIGPKLAVWFLKLNCHSCESHTRIPPAYT